MSFKPFSSISRTVLENINQLRQLQSQNYRQSSDSREKASENKATLKYRQTAATIRLLTILPERIFAILESQDSLLTAAKCYMIGKRVSKSLNTDSSASGILAVVPILRKE